MATQNLIVTGTLAFSSLKIPNDGKFGEEFKIDLVDFEFSDKSKELTESEKELIKSSIYEDKNGLKHFSVRNSNELTRYNVAGKTVNYDTNANFDLQDDKVKIALYFGHSEKYNKDFIRLNGIQFTKEPKFWSSDPFSDGSNISTVSSSEIADDDLPF